MRRTWLVLVLLAGACTRGGPDDAARSSLTPAARHLARSFRFVPIGLCEDYPQESTTPRRLDEEMRLLGELGVPVLRVSFGWDDLEPSKDEYDFRFTDALLVAAERHGIRLIPYVAYTPEWAAKQHPQAWKQAPDEPGEFEELMSLLARRYAGRIQSWELWNEPDNKDYWLGGVAQYATLVRHGARGVRAGDPDARVVLGGIAGRLDFLRELFERHAIAPHVDVVNLHGYFETWDPLPIEAMTDYLDDAAAIVESSGEREPIWVAEVGYSSLRRGVGGAPLGVFARDYEHTAAFQADALVRHVALSLASPHVELVAWYEVRDLAPTAEVIGDDHNRHLGVLSAGGAAKPALRAYSFVRELFQLPHRNVPVHASSDSAVAGVAMEAFEHVDGTVTVFAWLPTGTGFRRVHLDRERRRTEALDVGVRLDEVALRPFVAVFDAEGNPSGPAPVVQPTGDELVLAGLEVRDGETTIVRLTPQR